MPHILSSSLDISGSLISQNFIGDGFNVLNVQSASFALTASHALQTAIVEVFPFTGSATITGSLTVTGSVKLSGIQQTGSGVTTDLVYEDGQIKTQPSLLTEPTIHPVVQNLENVSGGVTLDPNQYNWFNITPSGDVSASFGTSSNQAYEFDLVWENREGQLEITNLAIESSSLEGTFDIGATGLNDVRFITIYNSGSNFIAGDSLDKRMYQFNLSSPYNLSTVTFSGTSVDIDPVVGGALYGGSDFVQNGTKLFLLDFNEQLHQLSFSTPFDITTYSLDHTVDLTTFGITTNTTTVEFNSDGTKLYLMSSNDRVRQFSLSTPYDITNITDDNVSYDFETNDAFPAWYFQFNKDGTQLLAFERSGAESLLRYSLSTPYDISTLTPDGTPIQLLSLDGGTISAAWTFNLFLDGTKIWLNGSTGNDEIVGFDISSPAPFNIAKAEYEGKSFSVGSQDVFPLDLYFNPDGTKMFIVGNDTDSVYQYTLATPFDIITTSYDSVNFSVGTQDTTPIGIAFNPTGTKMFIVGTGNDRIYQYTLATPFDISTASYDSVDFSVTAQDIFPQGIAFNSTGTKMFIVGNDSNSIHQYTLSTPFELTGASYDNVSFNTAAQDSDLRKAYFSASGTKMFIIGHNRDSVYQYTLSTPFDISTTSYDNVRFSVSSLEVRPYGIALSDAGTKMFIVGTEKSRVYEYTIFDGDSPSASGLSLPSTVQWSGSQAPTFSSVGEKDWFKFSTPDNGGLWLGEIKRQGS